MRHGWKWNTRAALISAVAFSAAGSAAAQKSLQQALLRTAAPAAAASEDAATAPSTSVASALQQVAVQAAVIFTGSIATVTADSSGGGASITFQVEQGLRGVAAGAGYSMHVSAWAGGAERYVPGDRALFLLTAPSVSGYSAPVMGERGIVPLTGDALVGNLYLRWIAADVQRGAPTEEPATGAAGTMHAAALFAPQSERGNTPGQDSTTASASVTLPDVHAIDRDLIRDLLRSGRGSNGQGR